jgi:hypothetical protein
LPENCVLHHAVAAILLAQQPVAPVALQRVRLPTDGHCEGDKHLVQGLKGFLRVMAEMDAGRETRPPV